MNERIIELAEQSGLEYNFDPTLWLKYEKFAELIVQECIDIAHSEGDTVAYLKHYFGVDDES